MELERNEKLDLAFYTNSISSEKQRRETDHHEQPQRDKVTSLFREQSLARASIVFCMRGDHVFITFRISIFSANEKALPWPN